MTVFHYINGRVIRSEGDYTVLHFKKPVNKLMIYDPGLYHTAICKSELCKIDKQDGKLYYRGVSVVEKLNGKMKEVIKIQRLSKSFITRKNFPGVLGAVKGLFCSEKCSVSAIKEISLSIQAAERVAFIGPNGAGKSTM